jgi:hypothetical protein
MQKCANEAAGASITYSWRLCLRNPPPLGRVIPLRFVEVVSQAKINEASAEDETADLG